MTRPRSILGFSGSLRRGSFNTKLLRHFARTLPEGVAFSEAEIGDVPPFDADSMTPGNFPSPVGRLIAQVGEADAIVFATPEYNYSIPGVLKNAIDWISREKPSPFAGKPIAIMSASTSLMGGVRAQYHLRQVLVFLDAHPVNKPEIIVGSAPSRFDDAGNLTDDTTSALVADLVASLLRWEEQLVRGSGHASTRDAVIS